MKKKLLTFIIGVCVSLFIADAAFAELDLDLGDEPVRQRSNLKSGYFTIKGGYDFGGSSELEILDGNGTSYGTTTIDVKSGFSLGAEGSGSVYNLIYLGVGAGFQLPRASAEPEANEDYTFNFLPIYALVKPYFNVGSLYPYGILHLGYNFMFASDEALQGDGETSGGFYWGIGGGLMFQFGLQVELLYSVNRGSLVFSDSSELAFVYSKITLSAGMNF